jgi:fatty-acyl-CoA synthase
MIDAIATHAHARPDAPALTDLSSGQAWDWRALDAAANRHANCLIDRLGPASGARVAVLARNCAEMLILQHACVRAGAIFVPLNWRLAPTEIAALIADCEPALLVAGVDMPQMDGALPLAELSEAIEGHSADTPPITARQPWDAPSTILFTSGTSGKPKGVLVSEANAFWGALNFMLGNGVTADSHFLCDMPLFHTAGLFANARTPILAGARLSLSGGFDAGVTLGRLADRALGITHYFSVPQMAQMLWNHPGFEPAMLQALAVYATGGAPNPAAQVARFVNSGIAMSDGFGMSETGSNFGMPVGDAALLKAKAGSIGLPYLAVETQIVDEAGVEVAAGTTGELWLRGPMITSGYWRQPEHTAEAFAPGGWFRTGDMARRDADGFNFLVDRRKDMYISGGENVYPAEVEAVILEMPSIAECAVVGIADERWGEVGRAYVLPVTGQSISADAVIAHCRARLAGFKVPREVQTDMPIPRTASGKVQKHLLR